MRFLLAVLLLLGCGAEPYPGTRANGVFRGMLAFADGVKDFGFAGDLRVPELTVDGPPQKATAASQFATTPLEFFDSARGVTASLIATYDVEVPVGFPITLNWALRGDLGSATANLTGPASVTSARWTDNAAGVITFTADLAGTFLQDATRRLESTQGTLTWSGPRSATSALSPQGSGPFTLRTGVTAEAKCPQTLIAQFVPEGSDRVTYAEGALRVGEGLSLPCAVFGRSGLCGGNFDLEAAGCDWAVVATGIPAALNPATNGTLPGTIAGYAFASNCVGTGIRKTCQF